MIDNKGFFIDGYSYDFDSDDLTAINDNDGLVELISWLSAAGTGGGVSQSELWDYNVIKKPPKGTYSFIKTIPQVVNNEITRRKGAGKAY